MARWTEAEDAMLGTMPDAELSDRTGRSIEAVRSRSRAVRQSRLLSMEEIGEAWMSGELVELIANRLGVSAPAVSIAAARLGLPQRTTGGDPADARLRVSRHSAARGYTAEQIEWAWANRRSQTCHAIRDRDEAALMLAMHRERA